MFGRVDEGRWILLSGIENSLLDFITGVYNAIGWPGVIVMMAIESAAIPLPSELIMPLAGWKLIEAKNRGVEWVLLAGLFGAIGNTVGSWVAYYIGAYGGRPFALKYGKYFLIRAHDIEKTEAFFAKHGKATILIGRFLPVIRHVISIPAGVARMPLVPFFVQTFIGSTIWGGILILIGYELGENWESVATQFKHVDLVIGGVILVGLLVVGIRFVIRRRRAQ